MELSQARYIAEGVIHKLAPTCERTMICGSVRRHKKDVHDIDIVLIPRRVPKRDMFGNIEGEAVVPEFISVVNSWPKVKGDPTGRYTVRLLPEMVKLEISICSLSTWASISLIRTGDADFTHMLMIRARKLGLEQRDGHLCDGDKIIQLVDEADYFRVLNLPFIVPEHRDKFAFR